MRLRVSTQLRATTGFSDTWYGVLWYHGMVDVCDGYLAAEWHGMVESDAHHGSQKHSRLQIEIHHPTVP